MEWPDYKGDIFKQKNLQKKPNQKSKAFIKMALLIFILHGLQSHVCSRANLLVSLRKRIALAKSTDSALPH